MRPQGIACISRNNIQGHTPRSSSAVISLSRLARVYHITYGCGFIICCSLFDGSGGGVRGMHCLVVWRLASSDAWSCFWGIAGWLVA